MLSYKNVSLTLDGHEILKDVSVTFKACAITTILGANGSGKSSLIKLLTKSSDFYDGMISYHGKPYNFNDSYKEISILKQTSDIAEHLVVMDFLNLGMRATRGLFVKTKKGDHDVINQVIEMCQIDQLVDKKMLNLSGGERQRVLIAMALIKNPKLLILDEPTTYLDIKYQAVVIDLIKRLNHEYGVTIICILHDVNQAIKLSDEIVMLKQGQVIFSDHFDKIDEQILTNCFETKFQKHYNVFTIA